MLAKLASNRIVSGLVTIISFLLSNIEDAPSYLPRINPFFWYTMTVLGVLWFIGILVWNRKQDISSRKFIHYTPPSHPDYVPADQTLFEYAGLLWNVWIPKRDPMRNWLRTPGIPQERITPIVGGRPFCPLCHTELLEEKNFFRGYHFSCPQEKCSFSLNAPKSSNELHAAAQKVIEREVLLRR